MLHIVESLSLSYFAWLRSLCFFFLVRTLKIYTLNKFQKYIKLQPSHYTVDVLTLLLLIYSTFIQFNNVFLTPNPHTDPAMLWRKCSFLLNNTKKKSGVFIYVIGTDNWQLEFKMDCHLL